MASRISHIFAMLAIASCLICGCKGATDSNGNNTHINIGDSIPQQFSSYLYQTAQLDMSNNVIPGTLSPANHSAIVVSTGLTQFGKNNAYLVLYDGDTSYYAYEPSSDVSIYLQNPGYFQSFPGYNIDETLQTILDLVFHNWITLPIATKQTLYPYDATRNIDVSGTSYPSNIHTVVEYIGDSSIVTSVGSSMKPDTLTAKHCRISITANITFGTVVKTLTHVRDLWFVPRIGYIARLTTRTFVPDYTIQLVNLDTTATMTILKNYILK
jgi:hypothetical protein